MAVDESRMSPPDLDDGFARLPGRPSALSSRPRASFELRHPVLNVALWGAASIAVLSLLFIILYFVFGAVTQIR